MENKGMITGLITAIGAFIVTVIVVFLIVQNVQTGMEDITKGEFFQNQTTTATVNETGYVLSNASLKDVTCTIIYVENNSGPPPYQFSSGNYTQTNCHINYTGNHVSGDINNTLWNITYRTSYTYNSTYQYAVRSMSLNLTEGVDNVSDQLPTILLIAAIVLLLGVLTLLIVRARNMGVGTDKGDVGISSGGGGISIDGENTGSL